MASITPQLDTAYTNLQENTPDTVETILAKARADLVATFDTSKAIKVGDKLPEFNLPDPFDNHQSSHNLLTHGHLVIVFYRGSWCPFCNVALHGLQEHLNEFRAKGVNLVAITPEKPDGTLSMTEKHDLKFPVLTDLHNEYARKLGIVWKQPDALRPVFRMFNNDLAERNGDDTFEVPIPATLLVSKDGTVRNVYLEPDYVKRCEPKTVLEWIDQL